MAEHTPTPWALVEGPKSRGHIKSACKGLMSVPVAQAIGLNSEVERDANAALIVRAVNSHDALVKALDGLIKTVNYRAGVIAADHVPADMINHADEKLERAIATARTALSAVGEQHEPTGGEG